MMGRMPDELEFRADLFEGTAERYDRFRIGYPRPLLDDLVRRAAVSGRGRLMDLACGTGQVAFELADSFAEVWAVDLEPDMIRLVREKVLAAGARHVSPMVSSAEDLVAPRRAFELVTVGNAFHRLNRESVAASTYGWLQAGGCLALLWADAPWAGKQDWQKALFQTLQRWMATAGATDRVPARWERAREQRPDAMMLAQTGFEHLGAFHFPTEHRWSVDDLTGFVYSTSFLPRHTLGMSVAAFEADIHTALDQVARVEGLWQAVDFAYDFFRRPGNAALPPDG